MSKQIVPREAIQGFIEEWPKGVATGTAFDLAEYVANRAAQWALDKAAKECDLLADMFQCCARGAENEGTQAFYLHQHAATRHCENAIRALAETGGDE
jgi:hypothetical protein